ncbi:methionine biosynthesis protein MetW-like protein [Leptospira fainei serovar Hurstbridge str. BUT 6]|uniref:Methionine biosynthesis protein MetW-like protein n=1 Tax=Leptospira fainei serovar Hurstbridge str. BUT 6 TaxID=1193011 RepID=S3UVY9_9LEPT|nr:class I SAM-dependent methyltransferase [Leptospira fainei]EPG73423.1 methionine biosynthesis protein MetW-like protein [Leptospira fainei serovar Hurstbridge str. BUT 6]
MEQIPCNTCGSLTFRFLFSKASPQGETFKIVKCSQCGLVQVNPQPSPAEVAKYYEDTYFTKRTDRGYDNYYSETTRREISRVYGLNLEDLGFFTWENKLPANKSALDVGCAAGYFLDYLRDRDWNVKGLDIAPGPVAFAQETLKLDVEQKDFLNWDANGSQQFDLVTLWASLEHLHRPKETLEKIMIHLKPGGRMILSTCRHGLLANILGAKWRYLNVPEHLYYYSLPGIRRLCLDLGYLPLSHITYGSGLTGRKNAGTFFKTSKRLADWAVKKIDQGDMMALCFGKPKY